MVEKIKCDVVVIGGGAAGLRAAIEARKMGVKVILIQKGKLGKSGTTAYEIADLAGYAAADGAVDTQDNPDIHFADIIDSAMGTCDEDLVKVFVNEAPESVKELRNWGIDFVKDRFGKEIIVKGCFSSRPRNRKIKGHGSMISKILSLIAVSMGVEVFENTTACDLVIAGKRCAGLIALFPSGEKVFFNSKATILATGGAGQLFEPTLVPSDITGDGYAMGYRAGAQLTNLEFMQVGFGLFEPFYSLISSHLWFLYPRMINIKGEEFLKKYLPPNLSSNECMNLKARHYPFSTRDNSKYLEISVINECRKNEDSYILLDFRESFNSNCVDNLSASDEIKNMLKITYNYFLKKGIDASKDLLKVAIFGHAVNGGLIINKDSLTTLPSLFAVGECAAGPYGSDRLGGNMFAFCQVFGKRAGHAAAEIAKNMDFPIPTTDEVTSACSIILDLQSSRKEVEISHLISDFKKVSPSLLVVRTKKGLVHLIKEIESLKERLFTGHYLEKKIFPAVEFNNLLDSALIMASAALYRKESRGSHYRLDYPDLDSKYECRLGISKGEKGPIIHYL